MTDQSGPWDGPPQRGGTEHGDPSPEGWALPNDVVPAPPDSNTSSAASSSSSPTVQEGEPGQRGEPSDGGPARPASLPGADALSAYAGALAGAGATQTPEHAGVTPPEQPATDPPAAVERVLPESPVAESRGDDEPPEAPQTLSELLAPSHPSSKRGLPRIIAVANQKGGVGKTTTTINLAACLSDLGYRVLVVDLDPQANATTGLGIDPRSISASMYDVILRDVPMRDAVLATSMPNLRIAPSSLDLAGAEIELVPAFNRERKLRLAIESMLDELDFVFIDCPPSLGLLTVNALTAANEVCVPIQCEYYALEGLGQLLRNVELVQRNLNAELEVSIIALVMFDARTKLAAQVVDEVRSHFGDRVCRQVVPRSVRLSEAPSFGQPIIEFDPRSRGALAYRALAKEVSGGASNRSR